MSNSTIAGRRVLIATVSLLSWLILLVAVVATVSSMTIKNLDSVGNSVSKIVGNLSQNRNVLDSILNEIKKGVDPQTAKKIERNRSVIEPALESLGSSPAFQNSISLLLNSISSGLLNGSPSIEVNLSPIANVIAKKVNKISNNVVISKKELGQIKPQKISISHQSKFIVSLRHKLRMFMWSWVLWLFLLLWLFSLKGWKASRTLGWQFLSVGTTFLVIRWIGGRYLEISIHKSSLPSYFLELTNQGFGELTGVLMKFAVGMSVAGVIFVVLGVYFEKFNSTKSI